MKKAQFYLLAAALLVALAFGAIYVTKIRYQEPEDKTEQLFENYENEASIVINNMIKEDKDIEEFDGFTQEFTEYARTINANAGIAYVLVNDAETLAGNYLGQEIQIKTEILGEGGTTINTETLANGESKTISITDEFTIIADDIEYIYTVEQDIELNALLRAEQEQNIRVKTID